MCLRDNKLEGLCLGFGVGLSLLKIMVTVSTDKSRLMGLFRKVEDVGYFVGMLLAGERPGQKLFDYFSTTFFLHDTAVINTTSTSITINPLYQQEEQSIEVSPS